MVTSGRKIHGGQCLTEDLEALSVMPVEGMETKAFAKQTSMLLIVQWNEASATKTNRYKPLTEVCSR